MAELEVRIQLDELNCVYAHSQIVDLMKKAIENHNVLC